MKWPSRQVLAVLLAAFCAGCATTGSVDALDPRLKEIHEKMSQLEAKTEVAGQSVKKLNDLSEDLTKKAEEAVKKAKSATERNRD